MSELLSEQPEGIRRASFIAMHAMHTPWTGDEFPDLKGIEVPVALMVHRADGWIGWPGGTEDPADDGDPITTAIRETWEEVQYEVPRNRLERLSMLKMPSGLIAYTFSHQTDYQTLLEVQRSAQRSKHFGAEITGVILPHLVDFSVYGSYKGGLPRLLQTPSADPVPYEIALLAQKLGTIDEKQLKKLSRLIDKPLLRWADVQSDA